MRRWGSGARQAVALIRETFPDAHVETQVNNSATVKIEATAQRVDVVSVPQRDMYRKYRWPAAPKVTQALEIFKEEYA